MNLTLICEHCGCDFGAEYHRGMDPGDAPRPARAPDPRVCDRCCRDTNPAAAPSTWSAPAPEQITQPILTIYDVRRMCPCGTESMGKTFTKPADGEVRTGMCAACMAADEARMAVLMHPIVDRGPSKEMALERPKSVREYDDELPFDGKMLAAGSDT